MRLIVIDYAIKTLTLLIVTVVAFGIVLSDEWKGQKLKANFISTVSDLDVVTIEAEKPIKPPLLDSDNFPALETYKPSVKNDDTKDKIAALDERVTQLESKFKTFSATKSSNGSVGGGSTGSGSVGSGSTGTIATTVYKSQAVPYTIPVVTAQPVRLPVLRRSISSPTKCVVDQYGRVICR
jgi:hypothetical protein